jgi:hypothetical protein
MTTWHFEILHAVRPILRNGRFHLVSSGRGRVNPLFNESVITDHRESAPTGVAPVLDEVWVSALISVWASA